MFDITPITGEDAVTLGWYPPINEWGWEVVRLLILATEVSAQSTPMGRYSRYNGSKSYFSYSPKLISVYVTWDRCWKSSKNVVYIRLSVDGIQSDGFWGSSKVEISSLYPEYLYLKGVAMGV